MQAIIFNYFFACLVGFFGFIGLTDISLVPTKLWFPGALILGALFISVFYLAALTTQRSGLSVVSVATKMSVAIPVFFGIILYNESTGIVKIIGILLALVAVYLTSIKSTQGIKIKKKNLIFPLLVFVGSGIIDTLIKYLETTFVAIDEVALFSTTIFALAGSIGVSILIVQASLGKLRLKGKNLLGGIILGIPNYFSIYFLVLALRSEGFESSVVFTVNNVAIVLFSTFLGILFFKERLITKNWIGILFAIISILMVATS